MHEFRLRPVLGFLVAFAVSVTPGIAAVTLQSLGGSVTGKIAVAKNADGRLEAFARRPDNSLWHITQTAAGSSTWSSWAALGKTILSNPVVAVNADGRLEVFALASDNAIWHSAQTVANGAAWSPWASLGGQGADDPAVAADADGRLEVFIHTTTNSLWHTWQTSPGGTWAAGSEIFGEVEHSPGVARNSDGRLIVFTNDEDNSIWWTIQNTAGTDSWSHWWCLLGSINTAPQVIANQDGRLQVFGHQPDGSIWTSAQTTTAGYTWSNWGALAGVSTSDITPAINTDGRLEVFARGTDNQLWHSAQATASGPWSSWSSLGGQLADSPTVVRDASGLLQAFIPGADGSLWYIGQSSPGVWPNATAAPQISSANTATPVWRGSANFGSNMYVSIYGSNLSTVTQAWDNAFSAGTAPTSLGGVTVTINNLPAFIQYVSPSQINLNTPDDAATGPVNVVVRNGAGASNTGTATRVRLSPTLLSTPQFNAGANYYAVAQTPDFKTFIGPANLIPNVAFAPAKPGDTVIIFATGCGPTNPATPAGTLAIQNSPLALPYQLKIGGVSANVSFAGILAGTVGLYQFNVVVPPVPPGDQAIELSIDGVPNAQNLLLAVGQ